MIQEWSRLENNGRPLCSLFVLVRRLWRRIFRKGRRDRMLPRPGKCRDIFHQKRKRPRISIRHITQSVQRQFFPRYFDCNFNTVIGTSNKIAQNLKLSKTTSYFTCSCCSEKRWDVFQLWWPAFQAPTHGRIRSIRQGRGKRHRQEQKTRQWRPGNLCYPNITTVKPSAKNASHLYKRRKRNNLSWKAIT